MSVYYILIYFSSMFFLNFLKHVCQYSYAWFQLHSPNTQCNGKCSIFDKSAGTHQLVKHCFSLYIVRTMKHFSIKIGFHPISSLFYTGFTIVRGGLSEVVHPRAPAPYGALCEGGTQLVYCGREEDSKAFRCNKNNMSSAPCPHWF